ncbi:hypothetical protein ACFHW2_43370 [Actinomadura sp. LOL_016]|uniref:hypothetical protein n=1 Tax=unclassified Actinomadura TaxID=2626254 RepID=UPI003A80521A
MVDVRTFNLWQELACADDLPVAALPAVIEVLTTPVARHLNIDGHRERWRAAAFDKALPALLNRTDEPDLRARLIATSDPRQILQLVLDGILGGEDVPAITAVHQVWPDLVAALARHDHQVPTAVDLVARLRNHELKDVADTWGFGHYRLPSTDPRQEMPAPLFTALLERCLQPLTDSLNHPEASSAWNATSGLGLHWSNKFGGDAWGLLEQYPDQWQRLVAHPTHGRAVQHILLEEAETEALSDDLVSRE